MAPITSRSCECQAPMRLIILCFTVLTLIFSSSSGKTNIFSGSSYNLAPKRDKQRQIYCG